MSHKDGRVVLSAWVDPVLRDYAREAAKVANLEFSRWVERAVRQTMARESADRAIVAASERESLPRARWENGRLIHPENPKPAAKAAGISDDRWRAITTLGSPRRVAA